MEFNEIELKLRMTLDALSNQTGEVAIDEAWIDQAAEEFKASLKKQLLPEERTFKLRASNIGRPVCQLQNEQAGLEKEPMDYNHIVRMLHGDAIEAIVNLLLKAAKINITGSKSLVEVGINGTVIKGEDDIEIDNKVYDVKSSSPYAFSHKWALGWDGVYHQDTFGYVEQLFIYAEGDPKRMGGWIVVDKSSGEVKVVEARPTPQQIEAIKSRVSDTERVITLKQEFVKQFEPEPETFYKKPTGNYLVPMTCTFCDFQKHCWPDAKLLPKAGSKAQSPKPTWYVTTVDT